MLGLTCSDLMFLTLCVPFTAIDYAFPVWVLPTWTCNMINYLQHTSAYFSVWTLTLMAADRFLAVCYPVESMTLRSSTNTLVALLITYGIIMLSQIQVGRIHDVYNYTFVIENRSACSIVSIARGEATVTEARLYFFSFNIFGYVIPLGITCIFYYFMLKRLWYMPKPGGGGGGSITTTSGGSAGTLSGSTKTNVTKVSSSSLRCRPETIRAKRKVTRLVMCVVVIWAICWLPLNICFFISGLIYPDTLVLRGGKFVIIVQISSQVLAYTNSCLNPILYPLVSENFRKGFLRIIFLTLNWCSFGRLCRNSHRNFRLNSRMEVTFYNGGSRSRSSTTTNRMSRTNSSSQHHRHNTSSTTNTHALGESSSLLIRSSFCSNAGTVVATVPTLAATATVAAAGSGADGILSTTAATGTLLAAGGSRTSLVAETAQLCGGRGLVTNCATLPPKLQYHYYHEQQQVQHRRNSTRAIENNAAASSVSLPLLLSASSASASNGFGVRARSPTVGIGRRCGSGSATSDRLLMSRRSDTIDENASDDEDSDTDVQKVDGDVEALTARRRTTCGGDGAEERRSTRRIATVLRCKRIVIFQRKEDGGSRSDSEDAAATRRDDETEQVEDNENANDENV